MATTGGTRTLKREKAGTYRTDDGRFTVEQSSSGWVLLDAEQTNELGLQLARARSRRWTRRATRSRWPDPARRRAIEEPADPAAKPAVDGRATGGPALRRDEAQGSREDRS